MSNRPKIVCLCGSTRFSEAFQYANLYETMHGRIVLSIGCDMKSDHELFSDYTPEQLDQLKRDLDELHLRKIDLADEVFILNVGDYIGESTARELEYAKSQGKAIRFLEGHRAGVSAFPESASNLSEVKEQRMRKARSTMGTAGIWSAATLAVVVFLIFIYALRTAFFFGVFALVISIGRWQVDHAPVLAAAVLCAFLFPSGSSSSKGERQMDESQRRQSLNEEFAAYQKTYLQPTGESTMSTYGQKYGPAMEIQTEAEAQSYLETLVQSNMTHGNSREEAERIERSNLGYYAGYYGAETQERVNRLFNTQHPIFGTNTNPTVDDAVEAGFREAKKST